jgi:hypothetical protein
MCLLQVTADVVPSSPILVILMMEVLHSSETSVLTTATWHNIPEDGILHSHCCENFKSYMLVTAYKTIQCNKPKDYDMNPKWIFRISLQTAYHQAI